MRALSRIGCSEQVCHRGWACGEVHGFLLDVLVGAGEAFAVLPQVFLPGRDEEGLDEAGRLGRVAVKAPSAGAGPSPVRTGHGPSPARNRATFSAGTVNVSVISTGPSSG